MQVDTSQSKFDATELELFIDSTIRGVLSGIAEADRFTRTAGATFIDEFGPLLIHKVDVGLPEVVEIDVAVTVARTVGSDRALKLQVMGVGGGSGAQAEDQRTTASRIKFSVPLNWRDK